MVPIPALNNSCYKKMSTLYKHLEKRILEILVNILDFSFGKTTDTAVSSLQCNVTAWKLEYITYQ